MLNSRHDTDWRITLNRVLVAGAGALGSVFGGFLRLAGHDVTLLGRGAHVEAIRAHGLRIDGLWGEHRTGDFGLVAHPAEARGPFAAVLLTVKSYDTAAMAAAVAPLLAADGVVISLQNGLGNAELIAAHVGSARVLAGRVIFGAEMLAPGHVRVTVYADPVLIGAWEGGADAQVDSSDSSFQHVGRSTATDRYSDPTRPPEASGVRAGSGRAGPTAQGSALQAQYWAGQLAAAGVPAEYCHDIRAALWGKVLYNAALNPLGALLGVPYGVLGEQAHTRTIMDTVIDEAFAVAGAEGVQLPWASAAEYRAVFYGRLLPSTVHHRSSMLQDLERGRATEIDAINGQVWRRGAAHGIVTPVNAVLTRLVHAREAIGRI